MRASLVRFAAEARVDNGSRFISLITGLLCHRHVVVRICIWDLNRNSSLFGLVRAFSTEQRQHQVE